MTRSKIIKGAAILTAANICTRLIGFFYRIYMSKTIGAEGMGLYQLIMPIYMLIWSISSSGFTTTISKLTAQETASGRGGNASKILKVSVIASVAISVFLAFVIYIFSESIAVNILKEPRVILSLKIITVCFPFMSAGSCIRGYFFGLQKQEIPAASQVLEQVTRVVFVYITASFLVPMGLEYACAAAVIGIAAGEIISFMLVFVNYKMNRKPRLKTTMGFIKASSIVASMAVPLTASRITSSLLSTAENILIPQRLALFGNPEKAMSLYGSLTGMAMPLIQFPSAFLVAVSVALVPAISEATATKNYMQIKRNASRSLAFTIVTGIGSATVFAVFYNEIGMAVYGMSEIGVLLLKLAPVCPFLYLQITLSGLLNGIGEHMLIFFNNIISSIINIFFIYFIMPKYGVDAFIAGWLISLIVTSASSVIRLAKRTGLVINPIRWALKPALAAAASGLTINYIYNMTNKDKLSLIICIFSLGCIYCLSIIGLEIKELKKL